MATITPKVLAEKLGTDAKTCRKYLRSLTPVEDRPGKGGRWAIESKQVATLKKGFAAWDAARREEIARRKAEEAAKAADLVDADEELEDAEDGDEG
jgi:dTDP-D-glucose 4,6-dehydratase